MISSASSSGSGAGSWPTSSSSSSEANSGAAHRTASAMASDGRLDITVTPRSALRRCNSAK